MINRWVYPMVPDQNISGTPAGTYSHGRHSIYLHKEVTLARGCDLLEDVVIGSGSSIGVNTRISKSVIGRNCSIGITGITVIYNIIMYYYILLVK